MTTRGNSIGNAALFPKRLVQGLINAQMLILRPDANELDPQFFFHAIRNQAFQDRLRQFASGSAQPQIPIRDLKQIPLAVPKFDTQRRIASILTAYDDLIENNTRRIAILEEMARRLYEEWFVHFRFPGNEDATFTETEHGRVPEGWEPKGLYDIAEVTYGHPFKSKQFNDEGNGLGVIRIRDIKGNAVKTYTEEEGKPKHRIENGDILIGMDGAFHMGKWAGGEAWLNQRVVRLRPTNGMSRYLLFLTTEGPIKRLEETIVGTTVAHLSAKDLKAMVVLVPPQSLLEKAADTLEPMYDLELRLWQKNANLRAQRDLLLPKLLSGEIDVSVAEEQMQEAVA
jgi:type I restriction enzyme S subunit